MKETIWETKLRLSRDPKKRYIHHPANSEPSSEFFKASVYWPRIPPYCEVLHLTGLGANPCNGMRVRGLRINDTALRKNVPQTMQDSITEKYFIQDSQEAEALQR